MPNDYVKPIVRYLTRRGRVDFGGVRDPRAARGQRWTKQALLTTALIGLLAVERTLRDVETLTEQLSGLWRVLGIPRRLPDSTLALFLSRLGDEAGLRRCLVEQVREAERRKALEPERLPINMVTVDGQTVWCSQEQVDPEAQRSDQEGFATFNFRVLHAVLVSASAQPCIDQMVIPAATNEMGTFGDFFERLVKTYGRSKRLELISTDAGMTSADNAKLVDGHGCGYLMAVKGDQPNLLAEAQRLCGSGDHKQNGYVVEAATGPERYQGKLVRRELYRSREIEGWPKWDSARQVWRVKQTTEHPKGTIDVENRYFVTNLLWNRLKPGEILAVVRAHWGIENGCHWTLDVVMGEDMRVWCKQGKAVRMLSWLRLLAYNVLRSLRDRYLRSEQGRHITWRDLVRTVWLALVVGPHAVLGANGDEAATSAI